jgi:hypothetical protein
MIMKKTMLLASGLFIALAATAQTGLNNDTIRMAPMKGAEVILTGNGLSRLTSNNNVEMLKNKFIQDYHESAKDREFPANAHTMIYLASEDGRRRIKAKADDDATLDVTKEIENFSRNLPPYHYTIYDLANKFEYHIYLKDPQQLDELAGINLAQIILDALSKDHPDLKHNNQAIINYTDNSWLMKLHNKKVDMIYITSPVGIALLNNQWSPTIGLDLDLKFTNRYGQGVFKFGTSINFQVQTDYSNLEFSNINLLTGTSGHFMFNLSKGGDKETWFGLSFGKMRSEKGGPLDNVWKGGLIVQTSKFGIQYDFIRDRNKKVNYNLVLNYYF